MSASVSPLRSPRLTPVAAAGRPFISVRNVSKTYRSARGNIPALRDITLDVAPGEFVSILGPSGCGKSTLLKCIGGLAEISDGAIEIAGARVTRAPKDAGFVFQRDVLLDWRTVLER